MTFFLSLKLSAMKFYFVKTLKALKKFVFSPVGTNYQEIECSFLLPINGGKTVFERFQYIFFLLKNETM